MNPQEARERAEQKAADQAGEKRVAREDERWEAETARLRKAIDDGVCHRLYRVPPWLFADERSQRKAEAMAREERPWDDFSSPWQNEQLFR